MKQSGFIWQYIFCTELQTNAVSNLRKEVLVLHHPAIHVTSEIGRLKKVMLHRPGEELENLMPEYL